MANKEIQKQIDEINQKLDLVLHYVNEQRLKTDMISDLVSDLSIVGKDAFDSTVEELSNHQVNIDMEQVKLLMFKFLKNIDNFVNVINMIESITDLAKDIAPITNEIVIDFINKLHEFEQRGYFEYFSELVAMLSKLHNHYTIDDFKMITANIDKITGIVKNLTNPEVLNATEKITSFLATEKIDDKTDKKSIIKLFKEINSPEVRRSLSYSLRLLKALRRSA